MNNTRIGTNKTILIVLLICCIYSVVASAVITAPAKFFAHGNREGISLLRDDHELSVYFDRTAFFRQRSMPYRDFRIEYPLLGVAYLTAPYFSELTAEHMVALFQSYRANLIIMNILMALVLLLLTYYTIPSAHRRRYPLWLFVLPSVVYYIANRFDIWPAVLVQASLFLLFRQRFSWAFIFLSAAFLAKGYAIVLFPVFLLYYLNKKNRELSVFTNRPLLIMAVPTIVAIGLACAWSGLENGLFPYIFQSTRTFASGAIFTVYLGALATTLPSWLWTHIQTVLGYALAFFQLLLPILMYCGHMVFRKWIKDEEDVINWSLLGLLVYIVLSVYYSPQWILWVLPFFFFFVKTKREVLLLIAYDIINYAQYPVVWNAVGPQSTAFSIIVVIRSIIGAALIYLVARRIINRVRARKRINHHAYAAIN